MAIVMVVNLVLVRVAVIIVRMAITKTPVAHVTITRHVVEEALLIIYVNV